jgi:hypothetical protein
MLRESRRAGGPPAAQSPRWPTQDSTFAAGRSPKLVTVVTLALGVAPGAGAQVPEVRIAAVPEHATDAEHWRMTA